MNSSYYPFSSPRTRLLSFVTAVLSVLHHADHVMRVDHSGFPFTPNFTGFTVSLFIAYPVIASIHLMRGRYWLKFGLITATFIATQLAHIFVETPHEQYIAWAGDIGSATERNLLNTSSPLLGVYAVTLSLLLSLMLIAMMISTYRDAHEVAPKQSA